MSAPKIYYNMYNKKADTRSKAPSGEQRASNETKQFDVGEDRSGKTSEAKDLSNDTSDFLRGTVGGR